MIPGKKGDHPSFLESFTYAFKGLAFTIKTERNIKVMLACAAIVVIFGFVLEFDLVSWAIVLLCCGVVLGAELLNTAIETVVDLVSPEYDPLAGHAKDVAAAAVWVLSAFVGVVGLIVFANAILAKLG